jgi:two-component system sensor histidine kinase KdpD
MVCISSGSPNAESLLRKGARLADRLGCPWYAVYIQTPQEALDRIPAVHQRRIANALALAHQLGGVPQQFKGEDVVSTIAAFAREYGITHIMIGRTLRPWYRRWFGQSLIDRLQQAVRGVDLTVVDTG